MTPAAYVLLVIILQGVCGKLAPAGEAEPSENVMDGAGEDKTGVMVFDEFVICTEKEFH